MRAVLPLLLVACGPDAEAWRTGAASLSVEPAALTFPATAPGDLARLELTVTNAGFGSTQVSFTAGAPFALDKATVTLGAGASAPLGVVFQPEAWEDAAGTLDIAATGFAGLAVALAGPVIRDVDGDGAEATAAGGTDCDDGDPAIHPGADDTCGDGIDADCDPTDDSDCDGDGFAADVDCDDTDPAVFPGATETGPDGRDEDCDGRVDEVLATPGDLVVTEMAPQDPAWIEICAVGRTVALAGVSVATGAGSVVLDSGELASGACAAICASSLDRCAYTAPILLDTEADTVAVAVEGVVFDTVAYDASWRWHPGEVWSLDPAEGTAAANDVRSAWCLTAGSAGSPNPACP